MKFDFHKYIDYKRGFTLQDAEKMNSFFSSPEVSSDISDISKSEIISKIMFFGIIIISILLAYIFKDIVFASKDTLGLYYIFFFVLYFIIRSLFYRTNKSVYSDILEMFYNTFSSNLSFDLKGVEYEKGISDITGTGFLDDFKGLSSTSNTMSGYVGDKSDNIRIFGGDIRTYLYKKDPLGAMIREEQNFNYLIRVSFSNPVLEIETPIVIKRDRYKNFFDLSLFLNTLGIFLLFVFFYFLISLFVDVYALNGFMIISTSYSVFILPSILIFIFLILIYRKNFTINIINKRNNLENNEFEKHFDVYCRDSLLQRKVLTPYFMENILSYMNTLGEKRSLEMLFIGKNMYIKFPSSDFPTLHFDAYKQKKYVDIFLEMKNLSSLSEKMNLMYLDKNSMNKKLIN